MRGVATQGVEGRGVERRGVVGRGVSDAKRGVRPKDMIMSLTACVRGAAKFGVVLAGVFAFLAGVPYRSCCKQASFESCRVRLR